MRPWEALQRAVREGVPGLQLHPGFTEAELADLEAEPGIPLPPEARELLAHCGGFDLAPFDGELTFRSWQFGLENIFPRSFAVAGDRCGNFWVVDVDPETGAWGRVFFVCHDPSAVVIQAADLAEFLSQVLDVGRADRPQTLDEVTDEALPRVYFDDPFLVDRAQAIASGDPVLSRFAAELPESYRIADLRAAAPGAGFSLRCDLEEVRRHGTALVFAVPPRKPSLLARLFGKRR